MPLKSGKTTISRLGSIRKVSEPKGSVGCERWSKEKRSEQ